MPGPQSSQSWVQRAAFQIDLVHIWRNFVRPPYRVGSFSSSKYKWLGLEAMLHCQLYHPYDAVKLVPLGAWDSRLSYKSPIPL
jgi:hypothetical protein